MGDHMCDKNNRPNIDPCGIPILISNRSES